MSSLSQIIHAVEAFDAQVQREVNQARTNPKLGAQLQRRWAHIRQKIPRIKTPTGLELPRLALPQTNEPGEIARYLYGEGLPGEFPFVNGVYEEMYLAPADSAGGGGRAEEPTRLFAGLGLVEESKSIQDARAAFREAHSGHSKQELDNIDAALKRVTRNDPDLLLAYYRFYADTILTNEIDRSSKKAGKTNKSIKERWGNLYTDINAGVLSLAHLDQIPSDEPLLLLGSTLIHEYVHTAHASDLLSGPGEGKAYGFEICTT